MSNGQAKSDEVTDARRVWVCVLVNVVNGGWPVAGVSMAIMRMRHRLAAQCLLLLVVFNIAYCAQNAKAETPTKLEGAERAIAQLEKAGARFDRDKAGHITGIFLGSGTTNDTLSLLGRLPRLKRLQIGCAPKLSDEGLVHLAGLSGLEILLFGHVGITDRSMIHLRKLSNLEVLQIGIAYKAEFNDAGLVHLKELKKLRKLDLLRTRVSNEALAKLKVKLPKCKIRRR